MSAVVVWAGNADEGSGGEEGRSVGVDKKRLRDKRKGGGGIRKN